MSESRIHHRRSLAILALLGAFFSVGVLFDLRALAGEFTYQHRMMACTGMYELKENFSGDDPQTICERVLAQPVSVALDDD